MDSLILILGLATWWGCQSFNLEDPIQLPARESDLTLHPSPFIPQDPHWPPFHARGLPAGSLFSCCYSAGIPHRPPHLPVLKADSSSSSQVSVPAPERSLPDPFQLEAWPSFHAPCSLSLVLFFPWDLNNLFVYLITICYPSNSDVSSLITCSHLSFNFQSLDSVWHILGVLLIFSE